jgi:hypothetical protein
MLNSRRASVIRRVERFFFDRHPLQPADVAQVVLTRLPSAQPREFILDRTNWKSGQTDVNVLLLAVIGRGVALPLFGSALQRQASGRFSPGPPKLLVEGSLMPSYCFPRFHF